MGQVTITDVFVDSIPESTGEYKVVLRLICDKKHEYTYEIFEEETANKILSDIKKNKIAKEIRCPICIKEKNN